MQKEITREAYAEHILYRVYQLFTALFTAGATLMILNGGTALFSTLATTMYGSAVVIFFTFEQAANIKEGCKGQPWTFIYQNFVAFVCLMGAFVNHEEMWGLTVLPAIAASIATIGAISMSIQGSWSAGDTFGTWSKMNKRSRT